MDATIARRIRSILCRIVIIFFLSSASLLPVGTTAVPAAQHDWDQLVTQLADTDPAVRRNAAYELGQLSLSEQSITTALIGATADDDISVRIVAAAALGKRAIATAAVVDALTALLDDGEATVRYAAARALGNLSGLAAFSAIATLLHTVQLDSNGDVRYAAAAAISHIGLPNGTNGMAPAADIQTLTKALDDSNWYARQALLAALATEPRATVRDVFILLNNSTSSWTIRSQVVPLAPTIGSQWMADFVPLVSDSLATQDSARLFGSIILLRARPQPALLSLYQTLAAHGQRQIRTEASYALGYLGEPAIPLLIPLLADPEPRGSDGSG